MSEEVWKPIPGYEGFYEVSNVGRVKSLFRTDVRGKTVFEKILVPGFNKRWGRMQVRLCKNGDEKTWKIHSLVAHAFLGRQLAGMDVNHIDGNKLNNCVENLEYCTRSENVLHAVRMGLNPHWHETHPLAKLTEIDVACIRQLSSEGVTGVELSKRFGVGRAQISRILSGKRWK